MHATQADQAGEGAGRLHACHVAELAEIDALIARNPQALQDFKAGKQAAMGALVGMIMKSTKGLNPKVVQERLRQKVSP